MESRTFFSALFVAVVLLSGCGYYALFGHTDGGVDYGSDRVIDGAGRPVKIPESLDNGIVTVDTSGPLRFLSVFGLQSKVVETDENDSESFGGRAFSYVYDLSGVRTHPNRTLSAETVESIAALHPSLVLMGKSIYDQYTGLAELLARSVTVMVIPSQSHSVFCEDGHAAQWYRDCISMYGRILRMEDRAAAHLAAVDAILKDIASLTGTDPGTTYAAGTTYRGSNGLNTTFPVYLPLSLTGGINAYTGHPTADKVTLDTEDAVRFIRSADRIILDPSSVDKLWTTESQTVLKELHRINNNGDPADDVPIYVGVPIVSCHTNYDCVLAASYYLLHLQYGTLTHDQAEKKMAEVLDAFYGDAGDGVFGRMCAYFYALCSKNGADLPLLHQVKTVRAGGVYSLVPA